MKTAIMSSSPLPARGKTRRLGSRWRIRDSNTWRATIGEWVGLAGPRGIGGPSQSGRGK